MFKRIMVPYDGSEPADAALDFAMQLAVATSAEVLLAHVVHPPGDEEAVDPGETLLAGLLGEGQQRWRARLAGLAARAPSSVAVETSVRLGPVADELLDLLEEEGIDLVIAGTHGVGGLKRVLLGSVSQRLLERAPCSVFFFRTALPKGAHPTVLVGLDSSTHALQALDVARSLATALGTALVLVHVADSHIPFAEGVQRDAIRDLLRQHGQRLVHDARSSLSAPLDVVIEEVREGHVREQMLAACEEHEPAIAVVGTRGIHGFRGLLVGSVARDLVNYGTGPVLIARSPHPPDARTEREHGDVTAAPSR